MYTYHIHCKSSINVNCVIVYLFVFCTIGCCFTCLNLLSCRVKMFKALDKVNYGRLDLCKHLQQPKKKPGVPSLLKLCCQKINSCHVELIREALSCIPNHLAPVLLEIAIDKVAPIAIITLISNWPLPVLW